MNKDIKAQDIKRLLLQVYKRYSSGEITDSKAYREAYILNSIIKAIETTEFETRLHNIENLLKNND